MLFDVLTLLPDCLDLFTIQIRPVRFDGSGAHFPVCRQVHPSTL